MQDTEVIKSKRQRRNQTNKEQDTMTIEDDINTAEIVDTLKAKKNSKTEVPAGFSSPVEFAKHLSEVTGHEVKPQIVYGYLRNMKDFPFTEREGLPRFIIPTDEAAIFITAKAAARAAKKDELSKAAAAE